MLSNTDVDGDGRAAAVVDWDDDGRLDLVLRSRTGPRVQVFHNRYAGAGNFVTFNLHGNGRTCNRDAIGARVTVEAGDRTLHRSLRAGEGFLSQSSKQLHFGLDLAEYAERVTVQWTDGSESVFTNVKTNKRYDIYQESEGHAIVRRPRREDVALNKLPHEPAETNPGRARRAILSYQLPLGAVRLPAYDNPKRTVQDVAGSPVLINFWERECAGCLREFNDFKQQEERLTDLGLRIIAMNANGDEPESEARAYMRLFDLPSRDAGYLDERLATVLLETIYPHVLGERSHLGIVLPTSFLLNKNAELVAIYSGPVPVAQLEEDVQKLSEDDPGRAADLMSRGQRLIHNKRDFAGLAESFAGKGFKDLAKYYRQVDSTHHSYFFLNGKKRILKQ